jgi:hypothetical protein
MKIRTTEKKETEIEIPVPSYYKREEYGATEFWAILNKRTICNVYESESRTHVTNTEMGNSVVQDNLTKAFLNWDKVEETEFLTHYERALTSMSLTPQLVKGNDSDDLKDVL